MTDNEKFLLLALIDSSISQLQTLRGAVSMMSKKKELETLKEEVKMQENLFGEQFATMLGSLDQGNEDGEVKK